MHARTGFVIVTLIVLLSFTPLFAQQQDQRKPTGVLANLEVDQVIHIREVGDRYLLTVIDGEPKLPGPHTILELGSDYIVVRDFSGVTETRIPIYSIQAVINFKGFVRK
jgi:hypothetical protein